MKAKSFFDLHFLIKTQDVFFTSAKFGNNSLAIYLLTIGAVVAGYFLGQLPMSMVLYYRIVQDDSFGSDALESFFENPDFSIIGLHRNAGFVLLILMFVFAALALYLMVKYAHKKNFSYLIRSDSPIDWKKIFFGFWVFMMFGIIFELTNYIINPDLYSFHFSPGAFFVLVLISFLLLPIQTSFEEVFTRGYLLQGMGLVFKNKWAPLILSSLIFASFHSLNPEIEKFGWLPMMSYYIVAGLFLGIITIMDDGLELALGVHAAINIYGALFVGYEGSAIQTDSLWKLSELNPWAMLIGLVIMSCLFIYIVARKYSWPSFDKLTEEIDFNEIT